MHKKLVHSSFALLNCTFKCFFIYLPAVISDNIFQLMVVSDSFALKMLFVNFLRKNLFVSVTMAFVGMQLFHAKVICFLYSALLFNIQFK